MYFVLMEEFKILIFFIIVVISGIILNKIFIKNNFLLNYNGSAHQKFTKNQLIPLTGGIILFISIFFLNFSINEYFIYFVFLIFILGFCSDVRLVDSPRVRFFIQLLILFFYVFVTNTSIPHIRFVPVDTLLEFKFFNYFFIVICLMILINGTNFIDGCNTLVVGYYLIIIIILFKLKILNIIFLDSNSIFFLFSILLGLFFLNLNQKLFLGDSGVYVLSFVSGIFLIEIYKSNLLISPYFICNLLWYPAFEVFFSILRKLNISFSVISPDTKHLHQLLYFFLSKKIKKFKPNTINGLTANIINAYNLCMLFLASSDVANTKYQFFFLIFSIVVYCSFYFKLYQFRFEKYRNK